MEQIMNYIKPELMIVSAALYFIGIALKKSEIVRDKYIPMILGGTGIVVCGIKQLCKPVDQAVGKSGVIW